jgi:hypothetical protein
MDKFTFVDTTINSNSSNDDLEENSFTEVESTLKDSDYGGTGGNAYCVVA